MNKKTLKALEKSIEKWEKIVNKTDVDLGAENCALCQLGEGYRCTEDTCPVILMGEGTEDCGNTPWMKWYEHHKKVHSLPKWWGDTTIRPIEGLQIKCKICERHAKAELKFLKSLLPKVGCHAISTDYIGEKSIKE